MGADVFHEKNIPTVFGLRQLGERIGFDVSLDRTEPGYWARPTAAARYLTGASSFEPVIDGGTGDSVARIRLGNWLMRMSIHLSKTGAGVLGGEASDA